MADVEAVQTALNYLGYAHADVVAFEDRLRAARLTEDKAMNDATRAGARQEAIGEVIGVSKQMVSQRLKKYRQHAILRCLKEAVANESVSS